MSKSPKLRLPVVEVELRPDTFSCNRSAERVNDPSVDDLPRAPSLGGTNVVVGVDWPDWAESVDNLREIAGPGEPRGAFVIAVTEEFGESTGRSRWLRLLCQRTFCVDFRLGDIDVRLGMLGLSLGTKLVALECGILSGSGKRDPLSFDFFFFFRFSLKIVVVVSMKCVVVV